MCWLQVTHKYWQFLLRSRVWNCWQFCCGLVINPLSSVLCLLFQMNSTSRAFFLRFQEIPRTLAFIIMTIYRFCFHYFFLRTQFCWLWVYHCFSRSVSCFLIDFCCWYPSWKITNFGLVHVFGYSDYFWPNCWCCCVELICPKNFKLGWDLNRIWIGQSCSFYYCFGQGSFK